MSHSLKTTKGFTLIELLVVIAIIGILSSVVLASLSTARAKSRDARRISDLGQVQLALELYYDTNGSYASSTSGLQAFSAATANTAHVGKLVAGGYLPKLPTDPSSGQSYQYCALATPSTGTCGNTATAASYVLGALLERTDNAALTTDADKDVGTSFYGDGATGFTDSAGDDQPNGTERVYDIVP